MSGLTERVLRAATWTEFYHYISPYWAIRHFHCSATPRLVMAHATRRGRTDITYYLDGAEVGSLSQAVKNIRRGRR